METETVNDLLNVCLHRSFCIDYRYDDGYNTQYVLYFNMLEEVRKLMKCFYELPSYE